MNGAVPEVRFASRTEALRIRREFIWDQVILKVISHLI